MKKTIWRPLALGASFGTLAGLATVTDLLFIVPGTDTENGIGFWMTLLLLSAALGGPLAGVVASTIFLTISAQFGPPEIAELLSDPVVFWSNTVVLGVIVMAVGLAYRLIFERVKMPARLLPWIGIIIAAYLINPAIIISVQFYLGDTPGILPAILDAYRVYVPQAIFDIVFTSLVFLALPRSYARPLWYEAKPSPEQSVERAYG